MLAQRMAKCNTGGEGPEAQTPGKSSTETRPGTSTAGTTDGPEAPPGPDASPDASFGKQWSSSSRSSYSSQHGGETGVQEPGMGGSHTPHLGFQAETQVVLQVVCLHRACLSGACRTLPETLRTALRKNSLMPMVSTEATFVKDGGIGEFLRHPAHDTAPVSSEGFSDSDEVFPKEMTKWNSNDFIDAFASPAEVEGVPGKDLTSGPDTSTLCSRDSQQLSSK